MRVVERPFSEFLRHPNDVVAELAEHDVLLRRRNAPALWLTRADHHTDRREAFEATARLLRYLRPTALGPWSRRWRRPTHGWSSCLAAPATASLRN